MIYIITITKIPNRNEKNIFEDPMSEIFFNFLTPLIISTIVFCVIESSLIYILLKKVTNSFLKFLLTWVILFIAPFFFGVMTININNYNIGIYGLEKGLEHLIFFYRNITPLLALATLLIDILIMWRKMKMIQINRLKISKYTMYSIPIVLFFIAWCVVAVNTITYLGPFHVNANPLDILSWVSNWFIIYIDFLLVDENLLIMNTFSSFFFGCYSWSIILYYLGTINQKRYMRVIKIIVLSFVFWLGVCLQLSFIGVLSFYTLWSIWHLIFGLWVAAGSFFATLEVVSSIMDLNFLTLTKSDPKIQVPRSKYITFRDFFERSIPVFLVLITLVLEICVIIDYQLSSHLLIMDTIIILLILIVDFLFSRKITYFKSVKEKEEELSLSNFEILLRKSKDLVNEGNKNYSKGSFKIAIEKWKKAISYYNEALNKAVEKKKIKDNLKILRESVINAYVGSADEIYKKGMVEYKKKEFLKAKAEQNSAISDYQAAIELIKTEKIKVSYNDLETNIKKIKMNLKQFEIEQMCLDADKKIKVVHSLQKEDLTQAISLINNVIFDYSEAKKKAEKYGDFQPLVHKLQNKLITTRNHQSQLQEKMDVIMGITATSPKRGGKILFGQKIPTLIRREERKEILSIIREYDFVGGQVRFKIGITNNTEYSLTNIRITFDITKALKWILHEPNYERKGDSILISKLGAKEKKAISLYLEPINCMESPINATVSFFDMKDRPQAVTMKPKMVSISCPIFFTKTDANLARVKSLRRKFTHRDKKVFPITNPEKMSSMFSSILSVLGKFDIKLIHKEYSEDDLYGEAWYYGITKVKKNQLVTYASLDGENKILEFEVSGKDEEQITAFLAEIGDRIRKQLRNDGVITRADQFYDLRIYVLQEQCPYCGDRISSELVQNYRDGESIECRYCNVIITKSEQ